MRKIKVQLLTPQKEIVWKEIPWGKRHLDWYRNQGYTVLMTEQ
jgi:hypothetical protein